MNNGEFTPRQALDVIKNLGSLESLKLNLHEHSAIQKAIIVLSELVSKQEPVPDKADELKIA